MSSVRGYPERWRSAPESGQQSRTVIEALTRGGIEVLELVPIECGRNPHNDAYLTAKADKLGHLLQLPAENEQS